MEFLWQKGAMTAKELAIILYDECGWEKTTGYTVLKRMVDKELIKRRGNNFLCTPMLTKEELQNREIDIAVNRVFDGSKDKMIASLLGNDLTACDIKKLRQKVLEFENDDLDSAEV